MSYNLAKDEKKIHCNNLFFKINDKSVVKSVNVLEEIDMIYRFFYLTTL